MTKRRGFAAIAAGVVLVAAWIRLGAIPAELLDDRAAMSTVVVDREGAPLYEALSGDGARAARIAADDLPPMIVAATLAAEDRRFLSHPGVDPVAIVRALKTNLAEGRVVEGGSTISQQVAKLLLNRQDPRRHRGFLAKIHEATLALRLEHRLSKAELLAMYLNLASYASQVVGIERASQTYFGLRASMLTPAQAALLAGLPQRPSGYNPYRNTSATLARQRTVLRRMAAAGALSASALQEALNERMAFAHATTPFTAPHFVEMVLATAGETRPARIETTIDNRLQADVAGIVRSHREMLTRHGAANVAVVVLDNAHGEWLAWEGSGDYCDKEHGGTINGPVIPRQPGSALKPFTYALAFEQGFTPASVLADVPSSFPTAESGVVYSPRNYDGKYRGPLLARRALAGSENVPAVALASEIGVPNLLRFLSRAGLTTFEKNAAYYGLGVTLGNAEVRLDELVAGYATFARAGIWMAPTYLRQPVGDSVRERSVVMSPRTAFWITDVLSDPEAREFAFGRGGSLEFPFPVAVKTGTSQAYHDNWTIGYSRDVTVGVWVGNFDRRPLRNSSGVTGAAPIFHAVMLAATSRIHGHAHDPDGAPIVAKPANVQSAQICALSGMAANAWCPTKQTEWIAAEAHPLPCSWHHVTADGPLVIVPPQYRFAGDGRSAASPAFPPRALRASTSVRGPAAPFRIANPPAGATYLIDPTLRRDFQTLPLRVIASTEGPIQWSVNGTVIGSVPPSESLTWPLAKGEHRFVARDEKGQVAETMITVR
jgi:penicillin-binding protein 1C